MSLWAQKAIYLPINSPGQLASDGPQSAQRVWHGLAEVPHASHTHPTLGSARLRVCASAEACRQFDNVAAVTGLYVQEE